MNNGERELEVKFYLANPPVVLKQKLENLGAQLIQPREYEVNYRFDTPEGTLKTAHRVLRLRQPVPAVMRSRAGMVIGENAAVLTYKGPADLGEGIADRQEIEVIVQELDQARGILEALGYRVSVMYEKYRTVYLLDGIEVTLDELPFGYFTEIEGGSALEIAGLAAKLGLHWEARIVDSYNTLFDRFCARRRLELAHLSFEEFSGLRVTSADLDLLPGDEPGEGGKP